MSSYKDGYGTKEPAGSLAPMDSTIDGSKWHHGVDGIGIAKLSKISAEINDCIDETSKSVAKAQIKVGRLLNDARALIPGDLQFGKWREANTSITNKSTANKLMNLAKQVGEGRITQDMIDALPMSTLKELISAPDSVLSHVRETLKEDEAPAITREAVRELSREAKEPDEPKEVTGKEGTHSAERQPPVSPAAPKMPAGPAQPPVKHVDTRAVTQVMVSKPIIERLRALDPKGQPPFPGCKPAEWAWMVMGMDTDPAILPNPDVLQILDVAYTAEIMAFSKDDEDLLGTFVRAMKIIKEEY